MRKKLFFLLQFFAMYDIIHMYILYYRVILYKLGKIKDEKYDRSRYTLVGYMRPA